MTAQRANRSSFIGTRDQALRAPSVPAFGPATRRPHACRRLSRFAFASILAVCAVAATATAGTPLLLRDIATGTDGSNPKVISASGTTAYFFAKSGSTWGLWKSDGTPDGTHLVADINPGELDSHRFSFISSLTPVGDSLYFSADDGTHGQELWLTTE